MTDRNASEQGLIWPSFPGSRDQFVETSAGGVYVHRDGSGDALMLLHSNGHTWREFEASIPKLGETFDVVAWDMPGHGWSDPVHPRTSVEGFTDLLVETMDELEIERAYVAGVSIGAFIAASMASRNPDRVIAASLVEFQFRPNDWWAENWELIESMFAIPAQSREQIEPRLTTPIDDAFITHWNVAREQAGSRALLGVMWAIREYDMAAAIKSLSAPVQVVYGADGPTIATRPEVEAILPAGSAVVALDQTGHFVTLDQPDKFVDLINDLPALAEADAHA